MNFGKNKSKLTDAKSSFPPAAFSHELAKNPTREQIIGAVATGEMNLEQGLDFAFRLGEIVGIKAAGSDIHQVHNLPKTIPSANMFSPQDPRTTPMENVSFRGLRFLEELHLTAKLLPPGL